MAQTPIALEHPTAIPLNLLAELAKHEAVLRKSRSTEALVSGGPIRAIAEALTDHFRTQHIRGYHCTREPEPGYFAANGLRLTSIDQHQAEFLERFGHHFTGDEQTYMREQWADYFDTSQRRGREGRIWACLTRARVLSSAAKPFFESFGGEAIYMPLAKDSSAARKLATLGQPVVVEVSLRGNKLSSFCEASLCALNYHHRRLNPSVPELESEGFVREAVPPADVLNVVPLADFTVAT